MIEIKRNVFIIELYTNLESLHSESLHVNVPYWKFTWCLLAAIITKYRMFTIVKNVVEVGINEFVCAMNNRIIF